MNNKFVAEGYNKIAKKYSASRDLFKNTKYLENLARLLKPGASVLDLGCGAGTPVDKFLANHDFKVIGIDISEKQVELAKKNVPKANFEIKDMESINTGFYKVDAVVSFYAIFHISRGKHAGILQKINSFLRPGGLILITMGASEWEGIEDFHSTDMYWSHFGPEKNREIIKSAGFEIIKNEIDSAGGEKHLIILATKK